MDEAQKLDMDPEEFRDAIVKQLELLTRGSQLLFEPLGEHPKVDNVHWVVDEAIKLLKEENNHG